MEKVRTTIYSVPKYNTYEYIIKNAWSVRIIYVSALISWCFAVLGFVRFLNLNNWYWVIFGPVLAFFTVYQFISYYINLFYESFDLVRHHRFVNSFWSDTKKLPTVDIFLPICGEETAVLKRTFQSASEIEYSAKNIYVLDDQGNEEHKALASECNFTYLSRENKGYMNKAGNLKYGFEHSHGEFLVIFDADFAPHKDFIKQTLPYMQDPRTAIVQTPQYFESTKIIHERSSLEYGAGQVQEDFYRIIQVARDHFGGAVCVGSNAMYRRSALLEIGGTAQIEHSEDIHTGFKLLLKNWKIKYIPLILAIGLCTDNMHAYFHQQHRWCTGTLSLINDTFWLSKVPFGIKLSYFSGFLYYLSFAFEIVLTFQIFLLLIWHYNFINFQNTLVFLPSLFILFIVMPLFRRSRTRFGTLITRTAYANSYLHAVFSALAKKTLPWAPTGTKSSKVSNAYTEGFIFNAGYILIYVLLTAFLIATKHFPLFNFNYWFVLFWIFYFLATRLILLINSFEVYQEIKLESLSNTLHSQSIYRVWWLKTMGSYLGTLVFIIAIAILYSSHVR